MSIKVYEIIAHLAEQCHDLSTDNRLMLGERDRLKRAFKLTNQVVPCPQCSEGIGAILEAPHAETWKCERCGLKIHISAVIHDAIEKHGGK
jgi:ribosomal protein S27AE